MTSSNDIISRARVASTPLLTPLPPENEDRSIGSCSEKKYLNDSHISHSSSEKEDPKFEIPPPPNESALKDSTKSIQTYLAVIDGDCVDTIKQYYQINKDKFIEFLLVRTERNDFSDIEYFLPEKYTTEKYLHTTGPISDSKRLFTLLYCQWAFPLNNAEMFKFLKEYADTTNIVLFRLGSGIDNIIRALIHFNLPEETNLSDQICIKKRILCDKSISDQTRATMLVHVKATCEKEGLERNMLDPIIDQGEIALPVAGANNDDDDGDSTKRQQILENSLEERPPEESASTCGYSNVIQASREIDENEPISETSPVGRTKITLTSTCERKKESRRRKLTIKQNSSNKKPKRVDATDTQTGKLEIVCKGFGGEPCGMKYSKGISERIHNLTFHRKLMRSYCEYCGKRFFSSNPLEKHKKRCYFKNSLEEDPSGEQYVRIWQGIVSYPKSRDYIVVEGHESIVNKWLDCDKKSTESLLPLVPISQTKA